MLLQQKHAGCHGRPSPAAQCGRSSGDATELKGQDLNHPNTQSVPLTALHAPIRPPVLAAPQAVPMQLVDVKGGKVEPNEHDMKQVGIALPTKCLVSQAETELIR